MKRMIRRAARFFGYDAANDTKRRTNPPTHERSEDDELPADKRRKVISRARDARRNQEIPGWLVRKHLDFTSDFRFRSATGVKEFDAEVNAFMDWWQLPENCDATGRYTLRRLTRLIESLRVVDGDELVIKKADGKIAIAEGDRIRDPSGAGDEYVQGVKLAPGGRHVGYALHNRNGLNGFTFDRVIPAENAILHGYFDRIDQVRGISPFASGLNTFRDLYENRGYALSRAKLSQLVGLKIKRKPDDDEHAPPYGPGEGEAETNAAGEVENATEPAFTFDPEAGTFQLDLGTDEDAEWMPAATPSGEFQQYEKSTTAGGLKSLDMPYSFYDEAYTNFFGSKAAFQLYLKSAESKREDNRELLDRLTKWRLMLAILDGRLNPGKHGLTLDQMFWRWTPKGNPWLDPRDIRGDLMAVHAGFTDYATVIEARTGGWFEDTIDDLAYQRKYMADRGVAVESPQNLFSPDPAPDDQPAGAT